MEMISLKKLILAGSVFLVANTCYSQSDFPEFPIYSNEDSLMLRSIFDEALVHGESYENLRYLCKQIGCRISGSKQAEEAVIWGKRELDNIGLDSVFLHEIQVPKWVRGHEDNGTVNGGSFSEQINVCALGGSVATNGPLTAEIISVNGIQNLDSLGKENIKGKIVFYNKPMDPRYIETFKAYGGCVDQRYAGAVEAAKFGAVGTLVRSMNLVTDDHPHTGSMKYEEGIEKIPSAAISTEDSDFIQSLLDSVNSEITFSFQLNCKDEGWAKSHNVIGEIKGRKYPNKIILVGGHLDSWDVGEGAHDDGAGVVQSMEVLRILKALNYKPNYTLRCVLFMNEENGNFGGKNYATTSVEKGWDHYAAIETDRGGFTPRGFNVDGPAQSLISIRKWSRLFKPYGIHHMEQGYAGVDIGPLKSEKTTLIGLVPDSQRYFDYHHSNADVFEAVNKRELELGGASMAALIYLIDKYGF